MKSKSAKPKAATTKRATVSTVKINKAATNLLGEIRTLIEQSRSFVAQTVNATLVMLNWHIGKRIHGEILKGKRADYGEEIITLLSRQLTTEYGRGFSSQNLRHMIRFAEAFPDEEIVSALRRQLGWTHFKQLVYLDDPLKRDYYTEMCRLERWSTRTLEKKIGGLLFERTALSKKTAKIIKEEIAVLRAEDKLTPDLVFRDPYFLDFLGLTEVFSEKDLEAAILREIEKFLLELGSDFAFLARQKRITVDEDDFYLDLLFYHRGLRRLIAVELKLGKFKPADAGQMMFYLAWLNKYERQAGEEEPLGLILCASKSAARVELLELEKGGIRIAEYLTALPPRDVLAARLNEAIRLARENVGRTDVTK